MCIWFNYPAITDYILNSPQALGSDCKFTTTANWTQRCSPVRFPSPTQDIYLNSNLRVLQSQQTEVWIWINKVSAVNIGRTQQVIGLAVRISFSIESSLSPFYSIIAHMNHSLESPQSTLTNDIAKHAPERKPLLTQLTRFPWTTVPRDHLVTINRIHINVATMQKHSILTIILI